MRAVGKKEPSRLLEADHHQAEDAFDGRLPSLPSFELTLELSKRRGEANDILVPAIGERDIRSNQVALYRLHRQAR